jgi:hypothetical protein
MDAIMASLGSSSGIAAEDQRVAGRAARAAARSDISKGLMPAAAGAARVMKEPAVAAKGGAGTVESNGGGHEDAEVFAHRPILAAPAAATPGAREDVLLAVGPAKEAVAAERGGKQQARTAVQKKADQAEVSELCLQAAAARETEPSKPVKKEAGTSKGAAEETKQPGADDSLADAPTAAIAVVTRRSARSAVIAVEPRAAAAKTKTRKAAAEPSSRMDKAAECNSISG